MRRISVIVILLATALCGCAGKMDAKRGLSEEWRLRTLEENFLNFKENQRESEERGREQQRKLADRVKAVEESLQRIQEQLGGQPAAALKRQELVASAPLQAPEPAPAAKAAPAPEQGEAQANGKDARPQPEPLAPAVDKAPLDPRKRGPGPKAEGGVNGQSKYAEGMGLVRAERGEEGRKLLTEFLADAPDSPLVPNALYWIGESHYLVKDYAQAILSFKEVTKRFPKHHKAAAALLKIGMAYAQMGEKDNAVLYLRALLQDHPKSEPAPAARKKLAELKG